MQILLGNTVAEMIANLDPTINRNEIL